ncbi:MAG TPA: 1-(5-phosphoribosyl)-5-[(5-phosphoribosylamino)methylideneamino] imidazole-4-carboxamide isomerase [Acidimicrobiales bacterium]|nr:1-(5-phosphoribosyl)-5-[(5-phosphoribosylamino)methylideneamino] imidazole-4-carboxamide isomerase [Acidimicrobiales bacterium]
MELIPAVDIRGGGAVRLTRGDFEHEQSYGSPIELARSYAAARPSWIHVVDLDAARTGQPVNRQIVLSIAKELDTPVQVGGGVRSEADAAEILGGGAARVVVGTAAVTDRDLLRTLTKRYPLQIAVGLDHRGQGAEVALSGWERSSGRSLEEMIAELEDVDLGALVVTSIERDGSFTGPDLEGIEAVLSCTRHEVIASGGVRSLEDLAALARLEVGGRRLHGAIVGKALVEGRFSVEEGIVACAR